MNNQQQQVPSQPSQPKQAPPRPAPNTGGPSVQASRQIDKTSLIIYGILILAILVCGYLVARNVLGGKNDSTNLFHVTDYFTDFDNDGDIDHVINADVIFNCGGGACSPANVAPEKSQSELFYPEATPQIGGNPDGSDPEAGGGGGPPPASTGGIEVEPPATATATPEA